MDGLRGDYKDCVREYESMRVIMGRYVDTYDSCLWHPDEACGRITEA